MADESYLKTWVSDQLMSLTGFSKSVVVQYVIRLSKEALSPSALMSKLIDECGLKSSDATRAFAQEIFAKVPRKQSGLSNYQKQEREAAQFAKKQSSYKLLDADDDDDDDIPMPATQQRSGGAPKKRFRKKGETRDNEDEDDDEAPAVGGNEQNVRRRASKADESEDDMESEEAMRRDQEEREQLERNLKERDAAGTRKGVAFIQAE